MEQLLVRLGANHTDPISWLVYSRTEDEIIASGELPNAEALSSLTERAGQRSVITLAPSSEILLKWVELPPKAGRKIISAIPFMLEDELATDISQQFFAIGPKTTMMSGSVSKAKKPTSLIRYLSLSPSL